MEIRPQDTRTEARRIWTQVARELQTRFAAAGFRLDIHGVSPIGGRAYVDIAPLRADVAAGLAERLRQWET
jgi:hypothetical protein